jgi:hypothetical protein
MRPQHLTAGTVVAIVPLSELQELHAMARELFEQVNALAFPPDDAPVTVALRQSATRTAARVLGRLGALPQHVHSIPQPKPETAQKP